MDTDQNATNLQRLALQEANRAGHRPTAFGARETNHLTGDTFLRSRCRCGAIFEVRFPRNGACPTMTVSTMRCRLAS